MIGDAEGKSLRPFPEGSSALVGEMDAPLEREVCSTGREDDVEADAGGLLEVWLGVVRDEVSVPGTAGACSAGCRED